MTQEQLAVFITKATKQYIVEGRNQVEGMTVSLASLFSQDALRVYMEETGKVISMLDGATSLPEGTPIRDTGPLKEETKAAQTAKSIQNLGQLSALFQGTWQPPA